MKLEIDVDTSPEDEIKRVIKRELGDDVPIQIQKHRTGQGFSYEIDIDETKVQSKIQQNKLDKINREIERVFEKRGHKPYVNRGNGNGFGFYRNNCFYHKW